MFVLCVLNSKDKKAKARTVRTKETSTDKSTDTRDKKIPSGVAGNFSQATDETMCPVVDSASKH